MQSRPCLSKYRYLYKRAENQFKKRKPDTNTSKIKFSLLEQKDKIEKTKRERNEKTSKEEGKPQKKRVHRVFFKKVLHEREEKMQEKMKMTWEKDGNLGNVQQQSSVYFCIKIIFKS